MTNSTPQHEHIQLNTSHIVSFLSDEFLSLLVDELNTENVTALALVGSYAHGDATPYSDIDMLCFVHEAPERTRRYVYRDGRLIGISTRTIAQYRKRFTVPEEAIFVVPSIRDARVLLDKEGALAALQREAQAWTWEPLQASANYYAGEVMMIQTESVHKILRALLVHDELALAEMVILLFSAITDAVTVQRGILATSGNTYFRQVQETVGQDSTWTQYHKVLVGVEIDTIPAATSLEARGIAALRLYQETVQFLRPHLNPMHREVIEHSLIVIENALQANKLPRS